MGKRGKPSVVVDRSLLEKTIQTLELSQTFENRSKLFEQVVAEYNKVATVQINPSIVYLRINTWGIPLKTAKGKPGRQGGNPNIGSTVKVSRATKFKDTSVQKSLSQLKLVTNPKYHNLVKRAGKGSLKAAVILKCIDCACEDRKSIKECCVLSCPLWPFRPFQSKESNYKAVADAE